MTDRNDFEWQSEFLSVTEFREHMAWLETSAELEAGLTCLASLDQRKLQTCLSRC